MSARFGFAIPDRRARLLTAVVLLLAVSPPSVVAQQPVADSMPTRNLGVLHPGDVLDILVYQNDDLSGKFIIDSRGFLQMPGVGSLRAAGLDPATMQSMLIEELKRIGLTDPSISVIPQIRLSVFGEVREQGPQITDPGPTLLELLGLAGGPTERADLAKAYVIRDGKPYPVNLERALAGNFTGTIPLYSNDVLVIPRKGGFTRENLSLLMNLVAVVLGLANVIVAAR